MNLDLIIPKNYSIGDYRGGGGTSLSIAYQGNITPQIYLEFAIKDFEDKQGDRSKVNAFANAKRAIHFQIDILCEVFGILKLPQKDRNDFQKKIDFCEQCGIVGKRILLKYNKLRNKIEHEYYLPQYDEVENIIDITDLFLAATTRFITSFPDVVDVDLIPKVQGFPTFNEIQLSVNEGVIRLKALF